MRLRPRPSTCALLALFLLSSLLGLAGAASAQSSTPSFVRVRQGGFEIDGRPYRFVGANFWYGMNLGSPGVGGDRARLVRELDRLAALGVTNLRVMASSEGPDTEPWRVVPSLQTAPGVYNREVFAGLDFLLSEMGKRRMRAVLVLNNFWPWSGGMAQYLQWAGAGAIPYPPPAPGGNWDVYQKHTARFYSTPKAMAMFDGFVRDIVTRRNEITGRAYRDDPTIMAWELANEPRGINNTEAFNRWIDHAATVIKSYDRNHLVTTGTEGETRWPDGAGLDTYTNHRSRNIDYVCAHIWAQNWGWIDMAKADATYAAAVRHMRAYIKGQTRAAWYLGKPIVFEEFGLGRDGGKFEPSMATTVRDRYFAAVFEALHGAMLQGAPVAGVNFWAWAGEGRPPRPGQCWTSGEAFIGDPPHESQGWYSVYDGDASTLELIGKYVKLFREVPAPKK